MGRMRFGLIVAASAVSFTVCWLALGEPDDLKPPAGEPCDTMRTLDEIYDRVEGLEASLSGDRIKRVVHGSLTFASKINSVSGAITPLVDPARSVVRLLAVMEESDANAPGPVDAMVLAFPGGSITLVVTDPVAASNRTRYASYEIIEFE